MDMECLLIKEAMFIIAYYLRLFVLWVPLFEEEKDGITVPGKLGNSRNSLIIIENVCIAFLYVLSIYEQRHEKTSFLHMRKQRHRSASR